MENKFFGMRLCEESEAVYICGRRFLLRCFPKLFSEYLEHVGADFHYELEKLGRDLRGQKRIYTADAAAFVTGVCLWGGDTGKGVHTKVFRNPRRVIARTLSEAAGFAGADNITAAIETMQGLPGLLGMTYASKHLRMLFPEKCVAYDSVLRKHLGCYSDSNNGYAKFCGDFAKLADELNNRGILNRNRRNKWNGRNRRGKNEWNRMWLAADVEAAVFGKYGHETACFCAAYDTDKCGEVVG